MIALAAKWAPFNELVGPNANKARQGWRTLKFKFLIELWYVLCPAMEFAVNRPQG